jgi:hypothetical protein
MRLRYFSLLAIAVAAGFLVVATVAFPLGTVAALALGVGIGTLAVALTMAYWHRDRLRWVAIAGPVALVSAWIIVASQVFSLGVVKTLTFAGALAIGVLAVAGLVAHELTSERVVHSLELRTGERKRHGDRERIAA